MILLLDTTVIIDVLRSRSNRRALLATLIAAGHTLATSALNIGEVYAGMRPGEEVGTESFLSSLECYAISGSIARRAGALKSAHARNGRTLTLADMIVAATALEHGVILITDKVKDFPVPELRFHPLA